MKPLKNIRVIDFSNLLPGPLASLMLSEAGAEVIKIEKIGGDNLRRSNPSYRGESLLFAILNRGKKSIEIDLKNKDHYRKILKLIKKSDVLIEQFRPGVMKRLKLDWQTVKKINKKIVYCSITGYGQKGKKSLFAGHDLNYMAESGLLSLSLSQDNSPIIPCTQIADIAGGAYPAFMNIVLSLINTIQCKKGTFLDVSMYENLIPLAWLGLANEMDNNRLKKKNKLYLNGGTHRYQIYKTKDERFIPLGALEDKFWKNFCKIINAPNIVSEEKANSNILIKKVQCIVQKHTSFYWKKKLVHNKDICCSVIEDMKAMLKDSHINSKKILSKKIMIKEKNFTLIPSAISKNLTGSEYKNKVPKLGEHNNILKKL